LIKLKFILLLLYLTIFQFFSSCSELVNEKISYFDWIPQETNLVIQINNNNKFNNELKNNKILSFIKNLNPEISKSISDILPNERSEKYLIFLSNIGKEKIGFTYLGKSGVVKNDSLVENINYGGHKIKIIENQKGKYFNNLKLSCMFLFNIINVVQLT